MDWMVMAQKGKTFEGFSKLPDAKARALELSKQRPLDKFYVVQVVAAAVAGDWLVGKKAL